MPGPAANALPARLLAALALAGMLLIAGCGDDTEGAARRADGSAMDPLPAPEGVRGSITDMPDKPGPGQPDGNGTFADPMAADVEGDIVLGDDADDPDAEAPGEPTTGDAAEAIQRYYESIRTHDYASAYLLWGDGGRASGQTPEQFAAGFADAQEILVTVDAPARMQGAMGSRYVEVPVAVETTGGDGRVRRYVGAYTLQRSVADGATPEQRAWHIAEADLRELAQ